MEHSCSTCGEGETPSKNASLFAVVKLNFALHEGPVANGHINESGLKY